MPSWLKRLHLNFWIRLSLAFSLWLKPLQPQTFASPGLRKALRASRWSSNNSCLRCHCWPSRSGGRILSCICCRSCSVWKTQARGLRRCHRSTRTLRSQTAQKTYLFYAGASVNIWIDVQAQWLDLKYRNQLFK